MPRIPSGPPVLVAVAALFIAAACPSSAVAQDDPFGAAPMGAANPFGDAGLGGEGFGNVFGDTPNAATTTSAEDESTEADSPLVQQLMSQAGRGNLALARSIESLARIKRWRRADELLKRLKDRTIAAADAAEMASIIGADQYLSLRQEPAISDDARAELDKLAAALTTQSESPDRLRKAIARLNADSVDQRTAAARVVLRGGNPAIAELAAAAVAIDDADDRDQVLRVLVRMGDGGVAALRQLALYGADEVRGNAVGSLARIDRDGFIADLVTAMHADDATESERGIATRVLSVIAGSVPGRGDAIVILHEELRREMGIAQNTDQDDQTITVWNVGEDGKTVSSQPTSVILGAYRDAADAARRLSRLNARSTAIDQDMLAASLAYRVMIDPDWGDAEQVDAVLQQWAPIIDDMNWNSLLRSVAGTDVLTSPYDAVGYEDSVPRPTATNTAAMIGVLRLLSAKPERFDADMLIRSGGGEATTLTDLAMASDPRVRYEAALSVSSLADGSPYAGSSRVRQTLAEMVRLTDRPTAIIVETRDSLALYYEQLFAQLGWDAEVVRNVAGLRRRIDLGGDLRLILSKSQLADLSPIELVDTVHRAPRGGSIPIVFYDDDGLLLDETTLGTKRWSPPVLSIKPPATTAALDGVLRDVAGRQRLPSLTVLDRQRFRTLATSILSGS